MESILIGLVIGLIGLFVAYGVKVCTYANREGATEKRLQEYR